MISLTKTQIGIVALAFAAVLPHSASAKGPGGSGAASHISSSVVGHVTTNTTTNKSNTPSNVGSAPKLNTMSNLKASQLKTTNVGTFTSNNFQPSTASTQYPVWGKSAFSLSGSSLSTVAKASNSSRVVTSNVSNVTAGSLKTGVQGSNFNNLIAGNQTDSFLGDALGSIPNPATLPFAGIGSFYGALDGSLELTVGQSHLDAADPAPSPVPSKLTQTNTTVGSVDKEALLYKPANFQTSVVGGVDKNITPNKLSAAAKTSVDTGLLHIPYTPGNLGTSAKSRVVEPFPIPSGGMTGGPVANPNTTTQNHSHTPFPFPTTGSGSGSTDSSPATDSATAAADATTPADTAKPVATGADLVLEDIKLASPATLIAGPAYTIKFRNQGTEAAAKFQVAVLVGLDGKLTEDAPRAVIEVESLAAGKSGEVTLRLPQSALKLAAADGRPTAFTHLFVAVDLMNAVAETDETNNTAIVERAALETLAAQ